MNYVLLLVLAFTAPIFADSSKEVTDVIDTYSKSLKKEGIVRRWHGLECAGDDKIYDGKIHEISLGYSVDKNLQYKEARILFYRVVDNLLKELNSRENLKEHFFHYPVTYKDLHFSLCFDYGSKGHLKKDEIQHIAIKFNDIFYYTADVDGAIDEWIPTSLGAGIGTIHSTGDDVFRSTIRKLPETKKQANTVP